jgi:hypothetical protein
MASSKHMPDKHQHPTRKSNMAEKLIGAGNSPAEKAQFGALLMTDGGEARSALNPQPVHLTSELVTEFLE